MYSYIYAHIMYEYHRRFQVIAKISAHPSENNRKAFLPRREIALRRAFGVRVSKNMEL